MNFYVRVKTNLSSLNLLRLANDKDTFYETTILLKSGTLFMSFFRHEFRICLASVKSERIIPFVTILSFPSWKAFNLLSKVANMAPLSPNIFELLEERAEMGETVLKPIMGKVP